MRRWTVPDRTSRGEQHPVYDFLWEYFSLHPSLPERWHPGIGVGFSGAHTGEFLDQPGCALTLHGVSVKTTSLLPARREAIDWIARLLRTCAERPPYFGCGELHEWAMVYRAPVARHASIPLRFPPDELACIVESLRLRCSHYDAFRLFTPAARPLNRQQPAKDTRPGFEQRGCGHVTMDRYKSAYQLAPYTPSELVADRFPRALAAREFDMRASPCDRRALGFAPVRIEIPEGRAEYEREQRTSPHGRRRCAPAW